MSESSEPVHLAAEVDVSGFVLAGLAYYNGLPHLFVSEGLDLDQPEARRRLGQTFYLLPVPAGEVEALLREYCALEPRPNDPEWREKTQRQVVAWQGCKERWLGAAREAWRARGSFPAPPGERVHWTLLRQQPFSGDEVRARLRHVEDLAREQLGDPGAGDEGDEQPF